MKSMKAAFLIGIGIGGTLMYQKYHVQMKNQLEKIVDKTIKKIDVELDEMM